MHKTEKEIAEEKAAAAKADAKAHAKANAKAGVEEEDPTITDRAKNRIAHEIAIALDSRKVVAAINADRKAERLATFNAANVPVENREANEAELTRLIAEERGLKPTVSNEKDK